MQVATNDIIILIAFVPIVKFLLGVSNVSVPYSTLFLSVFLFVVIPLAGGIFTRLGVVKSRGKEYFESTFVHKFDGITTVGLLLTLVLIFASQTEVILSNPLHILLIAVPLIIQTFFIFFLAFGVCKVGGSCCGGTVRHNKPCGFGDNCWRADGSACYADACKDSKQIGEKVS